MDQALARLTAEAVNQALGEPIMIGMAGALRRVYAVWSEAAVEWEHGLDGGRDIAVNHRHVMVTVLRSAVLCPAVGMSVVSTHRGCWKVAAVQHAGHETWELTLQEDRRG